MKQLTLTAEIDDWKQNGKLNYLVIKITLTNHSADTISYISMSCSWQHFYSTDTKEFSIEGNECNRNAYILKKILPFSKEVNILKLIPKKDIAQLHNLKFRIGFNYIMAESSDDLFAKARQLEKMKNIVWGNTIPLGKVVLKYRSKF